MKRINLNILLWIVDNLIALIFFGGKSDLELGLPPELKQISVEKYQEVRGRVIAFKTSILFNKSAKLVLFADDINTLYLEFYLQYLKRPTKYKAFERVKCFDIQDDKFFMSEISSFLFFPFNNSLSDKEEIKFTLENGKLVEHRKVIKLFNKNIYNSEYEIVPENFSSGIIHYIIASKNLDDQNSLKSINEIIKEANPIIKKIKSIRVTNNKLILES